MMMTLAAIGDSWGSGNTNLHLTVLADSEDFHIYPLINAVLFNQGRLLPNTKFKTEKMLRTAPWAGTQSPAIIPDTGWASENRFIRARAKHGGLGGAFIRYFHGLDYMLLHNLYYIAEPGKFKAVTPSDRPLIPDMPPPNWPTPPDIKLPPIGYGIPTGINVNNLCEVTANVEIPITIEYDDPNGNRDTVQIFIDQQPGIGFVKNTGTKNKFQFNGQYWDRWWWDTNVRFRLLDEDNNSYFVDVPLAYPGAVRRAPEVGHILNNVDVLIDWVVNNIPVLGRLLWDFTIYPVDWNCTPPRHAAWNVIGADNVIAWKDSANRLKVVSAWSILSLHGSGSVTIAAVSSAGGPVNNYVIPIVW